VEGREVRNLYKRIDVFRCSRDGHEHFENAVSVYHVLRERKCYPEGCVYFQWRCRHPLGEKGCPRGFQHVGRLCGSCPHFYDEKVVHTPRLLLDPQQYQSFCSELRAFEGWLEGLRDREVEVEGTVNSVKPWFKELPALGSARPVLIFLGFLLNFSHAYLDLWHWLDLCYLTISKEMQARYCFRKGDRLSFRARVRVDKGRPVLYRMRQLELEQRGEGRYWTMSEALLAQKLGRPLLGQPERCLACEKGALLDVVGEGGRKGRHLLCLDGVADPGSCLRQAERELSGDWCPLMAWTAHKA
jgi:hypothetical protein